MIVGGGPSLAENMDKIKELRASGVKLVAINNAYQYCLDNGVTPSAFVMVDGRDFNKRFVENVVDDCKYFIASQCDPSVFEELPKDPWGQDYQYKVDSSSAKGFRVYSTGPDRKNDGGKGDDISSK
jgi:type II secretory pathway pseudopilin PulG